MTAVNYCYWNQGLFELLGTGIQDLSREKLLEIMGSMQAHLNMVFVHDIDPKMGDAAHQAKLNTLHQGGQLPPDGMIKLNLDNLDLTEVTGQSFPPNPLTGQVFGPAKPPRPVYPPPGSTGIQMRC
jgi:hypothetical protein